MAPSYPRATFSSARRQVAVTRAGYTEWPVTVGRCGLSRSCERPVSAQPRRCRAFRRRSLHRTHSGPLSLAAGTALDAPQRPFPLGSRAGRQGDNRPSSFPLLSQLPNSNWMFVGDGRHGLLSAFYRQPGTAEEWIETARGRSTGRECRAAL